MEAAVNNFISTLEMQKITWQQGFRLRDLYNILRGKF